MHGSNPTTSDQTEYTTVRAKFLCTQNEHNTIYLLAVTEGSEENKRFFEATPGGSISLSVLKPETAAHFKIGRQYYVDITEAPESAPEQPSAA